MKLEKAVLIAAILSVILTLPVSRALEKTRAEYSVKDQKSLRFPFSFNPVK